MLPTFEDKPDHAGFRDIEGHRYGRWLVLGYGGILRGKNQGYASWYCRCACGTMRRVKSHNLLSGQSRSCGCIHLEAVSTHGKSRTKIYSSWLHMIRRCRDPKDYSYRLYGARGIEVKFRDFAEFYREVGDPPSSLHTIDRIDNGGHYEPGNVRWATRVEQIHNRGPMPGSRMLKMDGREMSLANWARELGMSRQTLWARLKKGWDLKTALSTKLGEKPSRPS